jgi:uracil-DNA glycosylase family 4
MSAIANEVEALVETREKFIPQAEPGPVTRAAIERLAAERAQPVEAATAAYLDNVLYSCHRLELPATPRYAAITAICLPGHLLPENRMGGRVAFGPRSRARLMLVLPQATGADLRAGRYLAGPEGKLLADAYRLCGMSLTGAYVTALVKFSDPYPRMNSTPAAWVRECLWPLEEEIARVRPEFLLLCGAKPLQALLGSKAKLYSYRGAFTDYRGLRLMATDDLRGLAANPEKLPGLEADMRTLAAAMSGAGKLPEETHYHYLHNAAELRQALDQCRDADTVGIDCEWSGESPRTGGRLLTIQFSVREREAFVVVMWSKVTGQAFQPDQARAVSMLRELFGKPGIRIVGQNFRADLEWLIDIGLDLTDAFAKRGFDTMLASHLLAEGDDHDLMALTQRHTTMGRYDYQAQLLLDQGLTHADLPDAVLHPYAAADADALMRIHPKLDQLLWNDHLERCHAWGIEGERIGATTYSLEYAQATGLPFYPSLWTLFRHVVMPASAPIKEMELEGLLLDRERWEALAEAFHRKCDELTRELRRQAGDPDFNPNSVKQLREILYGDPAGVGDPVGPGTGQTYVRKLRLGLTPVKASGKRGMSWEQAEDENVVEWREGTGWVGGYLAPAADADTLAVLADEHGCEFAATMRDYRAVATMTKSVLARPDSGKRALSKGVMAHIDPDGRVRTTFSQMAETGRYKSFKPALQNLPKAKEAAYDQVFHGEAPPSVRSIFVPAEGGIFVEADKKSAELYTLAYLADDPAFKAALAAKDANGEEISFHTAAMCRFFKLRMSPAEAAEALKLKTPEAKRLKGLRTAAKAVNFGIPYGRGARTICAQVKREGVDCTVEEAQGWIAGYKEAFPRAWAYLEWCKRQVRDPGFLRNPYGRTRHFIQSDDEAVMRAQEREATNFPIQSTVADALSLDLPRIMTRRDLNGLRTRIVLVIHDAVMLWVPFDEIKVACKLLQWAMVDASGAEVPGTGLRYGIDIEYAARWNEPADPAWLEEVSEGRLSRPV